MRRSFAALPLLGLGSLLTHCALTDHYTLASDTAGVGSNLAGGDTGGNASSGGAGTDLGAAGEVPSAGNGSGGTATAGTAGTGGGSEMGGASSAACNGSCTAAQTCCGTTCQNTDTDPKNCGACGVECSALRECTAGACQAGWLPMSAPPSGFVSRTKAAACAMGEAVFIWGGADVNNMALDTGAIYSPVTNMWVTVSKGAGMPVARTFATAVWTGSVVIVFGGTDNSYRQLPMNSGAVYDPKNGTWTALPAAPVARSQPVGYWDGSRALFWGGNNGPQNLAVAGAERFDLTSWSTMTTGPDPGAVLAPADAFDGSMLYLQGGLAGMGMNVRQDKSFTYSAASGWGNVTGKGVAARSSAFGVWDGSHFVVWGGHQDAGLVNDGAYLTGSTWTTMNTTGAPTPRMLSLRRSGWAFQIKPGFIGILGGQINLQGAGTLTNNGATYDVASSQWKPIADWSSGEDHENGVGVWTGKEFVLWSGRNGGTLTGTGERLAF